jgi:hemin uptake protein HemP
MADSLPSPGDQDSHEGPPALPREPGNPCDLCGIAVDSRGVRRTTSSALLGTKTELHILHNGEVYRLTLTRFGKLLLQK